MFGYYRCVGDDKKNTFNCHKAIEDQEGQDSAARELCDGSKETSAGRGRAGEPGGEPQPLPTACRQGLAEGGRRHLGLLNPTCLATGIFHYASQMESSHTGFTLI